MNSTAQALKLLFDYVIHTLITMLGFAVLVGATLIIHEAGRHVEGDFFQKVCRWVEQGLFVVGVFLLAAITICLTVVFLTDLIKNFRGHKPPPRTFFLKL